MIVGRSRILRCRPRLDLRLLYYTRAVASRRIWCVRACLVAMALGSAPLSARQIPIELAAIAGRADLAADYVTTRDRYEVPGRAPIELIIISKADAVSRAAAIVGSAIRTPAMP